jgi:uncharacterized membrane protein
VDLVGCLIHADIHIDPGTWEDWPYLFGAGAAGARGMLGAVASSMITVAGVAFSITIVALSLTSSQYTSRVLRNFMGNRVNHADKAAFGKCEMPALVGAVDHQKAKLARFGGAVISVAVSRGSS